MKTSNKKAAKKQPKLRVLTTKELKQVSGGIGSLVRSLRKRKAAK